MDTLNTGSLVLTSDFIVLETGVRRIQIDLAKVADAESRVDEIKCLTPSKAPELLASFTVAWRDLDHLVKLMSFEEVSAKKRLKELRARILIEEVSDIITQKKLSDTKDIREAIVDSNPEVKSTTDRLNEISCVLELVKGKKETIGMAYSSVKKIMGEGTYNMLGDKPNKNLSFGASESVNLPSEPNEFSPTAVRPVVTTKLRGFGKPIY